MERLVNVGLSEIYPYLEQGSDSICCHTPVLVSNEVLKVNIA